MIIAFVYMLLGVCFAMLMLAINPSMTDRYAFTSIFLWPVVLVIELYRGLTEIIKS
jgi:hypothetical protein